MDTDAHHLDLARSIVDECLYVVLGTADDDGRAWVSPVYFAPDGYRELFWVSDPQARHSRNVAARPDVAIVVYDTGAAVGAAQAVYARAHAAQVDDAGGARVFSRKSVAAGLARWSMSDVTAAGGLRLYRAIAVELSVLDATTGHGRDERFVVDV